MLCANCWYCPFFCSVFLKQINSPTLEGLSEFLLTHKYLLNIVLKDKQKKQKYNFLCLASNRNVCASVWLWRLAYFLSGVLIFHQAYIHFLCFWIFHFRSSWPCHFYISPSHPNHSMLFVLQKIKHFLHNFLIHPFPHRHGYTTILLLFPAYL